MQQDKEITTTDRLVIFIEKWVLFFLVLTPYLFLSYKIIDGLANPDPSTKEARYHQGDLERGGIRQRTLLDRDSGSLRLAVSTQ